MPKGFLKSLVPLFQCILGFGLALCGLYFAALSIKEIVIVFVYEGLWSSDTLWKVPLYMLGMVSCGTLALAFLPRDVRKQILDNYNREARRRRI
jgi:hypothetical protein